MQRTVPEARAGLSRFDASIEPNGFLCCVPVSAIEDGGTMATIPLVLAARIIPVDPSALRRTLNRFGLNDRQEDGQRIVDLAVVKLFQRTRAASGYLAPYWLRTRVSCLSNSLLPEKPEPAHWAAGSGRQ